MIVCATESGWAIARLEQCEQIYRQLSLTAPETTPHGVLMPLVLHAIVWWDEHHKKIRLGHSSKWECLVARDQLGNVCSPEDGGTFPERRPSTTIKYPPEFRGCFGAAMRKKPDGQMEGVKAKVFVYNNKKVIGIKAYNTLRGAEMARVSALDGGSGQWKRKGYGYKERYGAQWSAELDKVLQGGSNNVIPVSLVRGSPVNDLFYLTRHTTCNTTSPYCCAQLMDHVVSESKKIYDGTEYEDTFMIFHDGLTAWWAPDGQAYLKTLGFEDRQLRCVTANVDSRYYANKVVGDSPEICRSLDAHGFSDLEVAAKYNCALSSVYDHGDPRRFGMGTAPEVTSTQLRCWEVAPTSDRANCRGHHGFPARP